MSKAIVVLPQQNYDCVQCGRGCLNDWGIVVEDSCAKQLETTSLAAQAREKFGSAFHFDERRRAQVVSRKPNGHCVFLDKDESSGCYSCAVHAQVGYAAKPQTCKNFPFVVVETPDEIRFAISFYCRAAQLNHGRPLAEHLSALDDFDGRRIAVGFQPIQVFEDVVLDWEGYKVLLQFFKQEESAPREAVFARALLGVARSVVKAPGQIDAWSFIDELKGTNDALLREDWFSDQMHSCLHGMTLYLECNEPEQVQALAPALFAEASVELPHCGWRGEVAELRTFRETPLPPEYEQQIDRYLQAVLFRHYLASRGELLQSLIALSLNPALIRQYARVLAAAQGKPLSMDTFFAAIDLCEHDLMYHGRGFERLWGAFTHALLGQIANSMQ